MTLEYPDGTSFADGATPYQNRPATEIDPTDRIFIPITIEGIQTEAVLDAGGSFLICDPELVEILEIDPSAAIDRQAILVRGTRYEGTLHRLEVAIMAAEGNSFPFQATAFVPAPNPPWPLPTYMGWFGCLERIRFALDPSRRRFMRSIPPSPSTSSISAASSTTCTSASGGSPRY